MHSVAFVGFFHHLEKIFKYTFIQIYLYIYMIHVCTYMYVYMQTVVIKIDVLGQNGIDQCVLGCLLWQNASLILFNKAI